MLTIDKLSPFKSCYLESSVIALFICCHYLRVFVFCMIMFIFLFLWLCIYLFCYGLVGVGGGGLKQYTSIYLCIHNFYFFICVLLYCFIFIFMHLIIIVPMCLLIHFTTVTNDCSVSCADWVLTCINSLSMWSRAEVFRSLLAQAQCLFRLGWRWLSCVHRKARHPVWGGGGGGGGVKGIWLFMPAV